MIIYDLKCINGHKFEGWFKDRANYEEQILSRMVTCPVCGADDLNIMPAALAILGKEAKPAAKDDPRVLSTDRALQLLHNFLEKNFQDVGDRFCEVALGIHRGDEEERNIKGTTTVSEEELLREEGVKFHKIPLPKLDS